MSTGLEHLILQHRLQYALRQALPLVSLEKERIGLVPLCSVHITGLGIPKESELEKDETSLSFQITVKEFVDKVNTSLSSETKLVEVAVELVENGKDHYQFAVVLTSMSNVNILALHEAQQKMLASITSVQNKIHQRGLKEFEGVRFYGCNHRRTCLQAEIVHEFNIQDESTFEVDYTAAIHAVKEKMAELKIERVLDIQIRHDHAKLNVNKKTQKYVLNVYGSSQADYEKESIQV